MLRATLCMFSADGVGFPFGWAAHLRKYTGVIVVQRAALS